MTDKQTQLAWLDKQRSVVNDMIVGAAPEAQPIFHKDLRIINAITERIKEMTAVEFLIEMRDILRTYCDNGSLSCGDCPLRVGEKKGKCALDNPMKNPRNFVEIVKRWKEERENGAKTV